MGAEAILYEATNRVKSRGSAKGFLSEYQSSFFNNKSEPNKLIPVKAKDTLSFGNKSLLQEPYLFKNDDDGEIPKSPTPLRR